MSFFRKWKNYTKHKKLNEDWTLATNLKDLTNDFQTNDDEYDGGDNNDNEADENSTFIVKYLGNTLIQSAKSEEATADAIKSIIAKIKGNTKKLQKVNLTISSKGIEVCDIITTECIFHISIYKISYCSADATHSNVFAFIASDNTDNNNNNNNNNINNTTTDNNNKNFLNNNITSSFSTGDYLNENLVCYAFLCGKRKIAHQITLTVARNFESAYQLWYDLSQRKQNLIEQKQLQKKQQNKNNNNNNNNNNKIETAAIINNKKPENKIMMDYNKKNLLIDFTNNNNNNSMEILPTESSLYNRDPRKLFQNTWVAFEDDDNSYSAAGDDASITTTDDVFLVESKYQFLNLPKNNTQQQQQQQQCESIWNTNILCSS